MITERPLRRDLPLLVIFAAVCIATFIALFEAGGGQILPGTSYQVQAIVPTAVALVPNADVRIDGVRVGRVSAVGSRGGNAVIMMDLDRQDAPIYRNARVLVRLKSLVGENYVQIDPGTRSAGALPNNGVLPLANADAATQLDQILSTFNAPTRAALRNTLAALGAGLGHQGAALNDTLAATANAVDAAQPVSAILAAQHSQVGDLVVHFANVMQALGDRRAAIQELARTTLITAQAVAARNDALSHTIDELPATLRSVSTTAGRLGRFSTASVPVVTNLAVAANALVPAIRQLPQAARATQNAVTQLGDLSHPGTRLLTALGSFSAAGQPAVPQLDDLLAQADPALAYLSPYYREFAAFFANLAGMNQATDATGHVARVEGVFGPSSLPIFNGVERQAVDALLRAGGITTTTSAGNDYYPAPGALSHYAPFSGTFHHVNALKPLH
jgi:phospholipid/cholesterol/gamma-HCH transport system substrate-binding protein